MQCPQCNAQLPDGTLFCTQCGTPLPKGSTATAESAQTGAEQQTQASNQAPATQPLEAYEQTPPAQPVQPDSAQPGVAQPNSAQPGVAQPDSQLAGQHPVPPTQPLPQQPEGQAPQPPFAAAQQPAAPQPPLGAQQPGQQPGQPYAGQPMQQGYPPQPPARKSKAPIIVGIVVVVAIVALVIAGFMTNWFGLAGGGESKAIKAEDAASIVSQDESSSKDLDTSKLTGKNNTPTVYALVNLDGSGFTDLVEGNGWTWNSSDGCWQSDESQTSFVPIMNSDIEPLSKNEIKALPKGGVGESIIYVIQTERFDDARAAWSDLNKADVDKELFLDDETAVAIVKNMDGKRYFAILNNTDSIGGQIILFTEASIKDGLLDDLIGIDLGDDFDEIWANILEGDMDDVEGKNIEGEIVGDSGGTRLSTLDEPITLADDDWVTVKITGLGVDDWNDPCYILTIENKSGKSLYVTAEDYALVNGEDTVTILYQDVDANKTIDTTFWIGGEADESQESLMEVEVSGTLIVEKGRDERTYDFSF